MGYGVMDMKDLTRLSPGQRGKVLYIHGNGGRLRDLGFVEGETVTCLFTAPLGDPTAYLARGTVIALRAGDAALVEVAP